MEENEKGKEIWREIAIECIKTYSAQRQALSIFVKQNENNRKNIAIFLLSRRILSNIRAIFELAKWSYQHQGNIFFKLPVGLLLRNCLTDCITGLFLLRHDDKNVEQILDLQNHAYAKALFDEFEVYRDKIKFSNFDDVMAEHLYTMCLEDTFIHHLDLNEDYKKIEPLNERNMWKARKRKDILPDFPNEDPHIKNMWKFLNQDTELGSCADSLYAYYKFFSQWEHFSEYGTGDILANFGEDNIKMPMTFDHIKHALQVLLPT